MGTTMREDEAVRCGGIAPTAALRVVEDVDIVRLTLISPPLNILTVEGLEELRQALELAGQRPALKAVVLAAEGRAFCAGLAVEDHLGERAMRMLEAFHGLFQALWALECPTVAAVQGAALGIGAELATFCDVVIADEHATFGQPEIRVGVFPPIAVLHYPRRVGPARALRLLLTGKILGAAAAERIGLVDRVVPAGTLAEAVNAEVNRFRSMSSVALRLTKRAVRETLGLPFDEGLAVLEDLYRHTLMTTADAEEGLRAFVEHRKPIWRER
jgi:cyclohexa-1,5-dienecarbonyl-CoA hydratase